MFSPILKLKSRYYIVIYWLMLLLGGILLFSLPVATASDPIEAGYRDFSFPSGTGGNSEPSGEKPESKLWWNDGYWWGILWSTFGNAYHIYRLEQSTQDWIDTGTAVDDRNDSRADALWDGQYLYVVSHIFAKNAGASAPSGQRGELYRFSYDTGAKTYSLDSIFPVEVTAGKSETLVLAKDSTGQLWVTYVENQQVMVNRSIGGNDSVWGTPFVLPAGNSANVSSDDISTIVDFEGRIGVMWSNQSGSKTMYFAVHDDSASDTQGWQSDVAYGLSGDDHINLKAVEGDSAGKVFAAIKTSKSADLIVLLVCVAGDCSTANDWESHTVSDGSFGPTRPILLLDPSNRDLYVLTRSKNNGDGIYYKTTDMDNIQFTPGSLGTSFIKSALATESGINDPSSTKQNLNGTTGMVVLATDGGPDLYFHNYSDIAGADVPDINVTPPSVDFGNLAIGVPGVEYVTLHNVGTADLEVTNIYLGGGSSSEFVITSNPSPVTIGAGGSELVEVTYTPVDLGMDSAALQIASNDPDEPLVTVNLSGSGIAFVPDIDVTPLAHNYGNVVIGAIGVLDVTIQNLGADVLNVSDITFGGGSSADFDVSSAPVLPLNIPAGGSETVVVTYSPLGLGADSGTLEIFSDDPDEPMVEVNLTGNGVDGPPPGVTYQEVQSGGSSGISTVSTVGSLSGGSGDLYLAAISTRPNVAVASVSGLGLSWSLVDAQCTGRNVNNLEVWMAQGSGAGVVTASFVSATTNAVIVVSRYSGADTVTPLGDLVSGNTNGVEGVCSGGTDNAVYSFDLTTSVDGAVVYGAASMRNKFHNPGVDYTERAEVAQGGGGSMTSVAVEDTTVVTAGLVAVDGTFHRSVDWAVIGLEIIPGSGGSGYIPDIALIPAGHDYGDVTLGDTATQIFEVHNVGSGVLDVSVTDFISTSDFTIFSGGAPFTVDPGAFHEVEVHFVPGSEGVQSDTLRIVSNDPDEDPFFVPLDGNGTLVPVPDIALVPAGHDYGDVTLGDTATQIFEVHNVGSGVLDVSVTDFISTSDFTIFSGGAPFTVDPGAFHEVEVHFVPGSEGVQSDTLRIVSNDPDEDPFFVPLDGNGTLVPVPDIALVPANHDYGDVTLGDTATQIFEVHNVGSGVLDVSVTDFIDTSDFTIFSGGAPFTVDPGAFHEVEVHFVPGSEGVQSDTLRIVSNDPDEDPFFVPLDGNGVAGSPGGGPVVFEEVQSGGSSGISTVSTVGSLSGGSGDLYLAAISTRPNVAVASVSGLGLSWSRVDAQCTGRNVNNLEVWMAQGSGAGVVTASFVSPTTNAVIVVSRYSGADTVTPIGDLVSGNTNGVEGVCSGGTDNAVYSFDLTTSVDGAVVYGAASMRNKFHNPGVDYTERAEVAQGGGGSMTSVAVEDTTVVTAGLVAVDGTFHRSVDWAVIGLEIIPGSGGSGYIPDIALIPAGHDYGDVTLGDTATQIFEVHNVGSGVLDVSVTDFISTSDFTIFSGGAPFTVDPGAFHEVEVHFVPGSEGVQSDTLRIVSNDPDEDPFFVPLDGNGTLVPVPDIALVPAGHDYGDVTLGDTATQIFEVHNVGSGVLDVSVTDFISTSDFTIFSGGAPFTVDPGAFHEVEVHFVPGSEGVQSDTLRIVSNDPDEDPFFVPLDGNGTLVPVPDIALVPANHDYGDVTLGDTATQIFEVHNVGSGVLDVSVTDFIDTSDFTIFSGGAPFTVDPGAFHEVEVHFVPGSEGVQSDTLRIVSNDPDEDPFFVPLDGNGVAGSPGGGPVVFEEVQSGGSSGISTVSTVGSLSGGSGDLYLAAISTRPNVAVASVSGLGLSWSRVDAQCTGRNVNNLEVWMAQGSGAGVVTASFVSSTTNAAMVVSRYSGVDSVTPLGDMVSGNTNGAEGICSGGSDSAVYSFDLTTSVDGAVVYGAASMRNKQHIPGIDYTERAEVAQGGGGSMTSVAVEDTTVVTAGLVAVDGTFHRTVDWAVIGLVIRPGG